MGRQWGSLFHVHLPLLFTSKVQHFKNFRPILCNILFADQPMSSMPFRAIDQYLQTSPMVKSVTNRRHWWNRPHSADWPLITLLVNNFYYQGLLINQLKQTEFGKKLFVNQHGYFRQDLLSLNILKIVNNSVRFSEVRLNCQQLYHYFEDNQEDIQCGLEVRKFKLLISIRI